MSEKRIETSIALESQIVELLKEKAPKAVEDISNAQSRLADLQAIKDSRQLSAPAPAPDLAPKTP